MDSLHFDGYASYSDSSAPRTPSPNQPPLMNMTFPMKQGLMDEPVRNLFHGDHHDDNAVIVHPENPYGWAGPQPGANIQFAHNNGSRGSLLQDLYSDHDIPDHQHHLTPEFPNAEPQYVTDNWNHQQQQNSRQHDFQAMRRATFPYVRHDREDVLPPIPQQQVPHFFPHHQQQQLHQFSSRHDPMYPESITLPQPGDHFSPQPHYQEFDEGANIKLEDGSMMMPPQNFYRSQSSSSTSSNMCHPMTMSYLSPHTGLPVQHTDDAASKETQYLRRRCFNCHTTEPPSWRRSTLNPGKIVCNKCGLYERTHLRPRPLRFDELRAGNKARKQNKRTLSPKSRVGTAAAAANGGAPGSPNLIKKEPREFGLVRRSSVSSISSAQSGSGASDWDDNGKHLQFPTPRQFTHLTIYSITVLLWLSPSNLVQLSSYLALPTLPRRLVVAQRRWRLRHSPPQCPTLRHRLYQPHRGSIWLPSTPLILTVRASWDAQRPPKQLKRLQLPPTQSNISRGLLPSNLHRSGRLLHDEAANRVCW